MEINFYFRKKGSGFSIEKIFLELAKAISTDDCQVNALYCPFQGGKNLIAVFLNGLWARRNAKAINHISGEVHYLALFLPKNSCVLTIHDCLHLKSSGIRGWIYRLLWFYLPVRTSRAVTVVSQETKSDLFRITGIPASKLQVIPNFVCDPFQFRPKQSFPQKPIFLVIGTGENKNIPRIIEAVKECRLHLRIIGKLSPSYLEQLEATGNEWNNAFNLTDQEILKEYMECDAVLMPSLQEGFGMPIIEAQAIGRPVITSNISPMNTIAGLGAILVDPQSVSSIRSAVKDLLSGKINRAERVEQGRLNVQRFRLNNIRKQYQAVYRNLFQP